MVYLLGILPAAVTICIASWQHIVLQRYKKEERELAAEQADQKRQRQRRRELRETWEAMFQEIHEILRKLEDVESEVRRQGPLDHASIGRVELGRIQWQLENVSGRGPEALRDPLLAVAEAVGKLRGVVVLPDAEVIARYTGILARAGEITPEIAASALGARAVEQYRAAVALHEAIDTAWRAINTERGSDA
jgi:hypothetical protein